MTDTNPYKVYADETILNASPLALVVALYEGAIEACVSARNSLAVNDIPARTRSVNKALNIINELMFSLNDEKGGEVSQNLRRLYVYLQGKIIQAHTRQTAVPLEEAERLLSTMLEGWKTASSKFQAAAVSVPSFDDNSYDTTIDSSSDYGREVDRPYGFYLQASDGQRPSAYSF